MLPVVASEAFSGCKLTVANAMLRILTFSINFGFNAGEFFPVRFHQGIFVAQLTIVLIRRRAVTGANTISVSL